MMNQKLIGLMIVAAMGVTACGSSGGGVKNGYAQKFPIGSGSSTTTNNSSNNNSTTNTSSGGVTTTPTVQTATFAGFAMTYGDKFEETDQNGKTGTEVLSYDVNGDDDHNPNYKAPENRDQIRRLQVEGRDILLIPDDQVGVKDWIPQTGTPKEGAIYVGSGSTGSNGTSVGVHGPNVYAPDTQTWKIVGNQLQNATFGEVYDQFEKRYQFAQGETTPSDNMPTARGEVKYSGYATYNPQFVEAKEKPVTGRSEFIVDFGEKTVIGQIQPKTDAASAKEKFTPVTLKAVIDGNTFKGVHSTENKLNHGASVRGAFYGKNAEEMAGLYFYSKNGKLSEEGRVNDEIDGSKPNGTFGAIKQ